MFTIGKSGENFIIFTDSAESVAGMTKVTFDAAEAETLVRQAAFLLGLSMPLTAAPAFGFAHPATGARIRDTQRPTALTVTEHEPGAADDALETFENATEEARRVDAAALAARRAHEDLQRRREDERELRRIAKMGSAADE